MKIQFKHLIVGYLLAIFIGLMFLAFTPSANAQVMVGGKDLNKETDFFELYIFKAPFQREPSLFIDWGQRGFNINRYGDKRQAVYDLNDRLFNRGEHLRLRKYLRSQGWKKVDRRKEDFDGASYFTGKRAVGWVETYERVVEP